MNQSNATFGMTFEIVYKDHVYPYRPLRETLNGIMGTRNFHITLVHTFDNYEDEFEKIAKDLIGQKDIKFTLNGKNRVIMKLNCDNDTFNKTLREIRGSELRGYDKYEVKTGIISPVDDLHILFPNIDDINFVYEHIDHVKPVSIYLKKNGSKQKFFEYFF